MNYRELTDELCEKLNLCWNEFPQMKYFATLLFTGAVLFREDTGAGLLINIVEVYGRTQFVDEHCEKNDESWPPTEASYKNVWPKTLYTPDGKKLVIGTKTLNVLITSSLTLNNNNAPEVGPGTTNFVLNSTEASANTKVYINEQCLQESLTILEDSDREAVDLSNSLYQLRQLRSKFHKPSTYLKLRYSAKYLHTFNHQPVTIFTYGNFVSKRDKKQVDKELNMTDGRIGSRFFMEVASEVLKDGIGGRLKKDTVEMLLLESTGKETRVVKELTAIKELFGEEENMRILYNKELSFRLTKLAPYLTRANAELSGEMHCNREFIWNTDFSLKREYHFFQTDKINHVLQVSLTKNIHNELNYYSQPTRHYTQLPHEESSLESGELFPPTSLPTARNIDLQDIYLSSKRIAQSTANTTSTTLTNNDRLSRRYQPYNKSKKNTTTTTTTATTTTNNCHPTTEEFLNMEPLFAPVISSNHQLSTQRRPSLILDDEEVFAEFDDFIHSPTRFLSSPPPSPTLSPFENDNEDMDFNDFPLFP